MGVSQDPRRDGGRGVKAAASTVWEILRNAGINPAPRRGEPTWSQFLRSQAESILACDFVTAELLDSTQAYVLAVIEHAASRIRILGVTQHPAGTWTAQQARNLLMDLGDQTHRVRFMIRDRGSNFTSGFDAVLADASIRTVRCSVRAPRMSAIANAGSGDAAESSWTAPSSGARAICGESCARTRPTTIGTGLTGRWTPLRR